MLPAAARTCLPAAARTYLGVAKKVAVVDLHRAAGDEGLARQLGHGALHLERPVQVQLRVRKQCAEKQVRQEGEGACKAAHARALSRPRTGKHLRALTNNPRKNKGQGLSGRVCHT